MDLTDPNAMTPISELLGDNKIRFHVIDESDCQRSSDWIIWESKSSLYLAVTTLSGLLKLSLHPRDTSNDGYDTQFSTTAKFWRELQSKGLSAHAPFHRWRRPKPLAMKASLVASVTFPTAYLQSIVKPKKFSGKKIAFPLPAIGKAVELMVLNHLDNWPLLEDALIKGGLTPMFGIDLVDGERISIVVRYTDFPVLPDEMFPKPAEEMVWFGKELDDDVPVTNVHGILVQSLPEDGMPLALAEINGFNVTRTGQTNRPQN